MHAFRPRSPSSFFFYVDPLTLTNGGGPGCYLQILLLSSTLQRIHPRQCSPLGESRLERLGTWETLILGGGDFFIGGTPP